jgi:hypothetical protein
MSRFGISKKAAEQAEAQMSFALQVPTTNVETKTTKNGEEYRWTEDVVIKKAFNEDAPIKDAKGAPTGDFRTQFTIQMQVSPGSDNKGKTVIGRHLVNYAALNSGSEVDSFLNAMSINVLKTLLRTLDYTMEDGDPFAGLESIFPDKDTAKSPDEGKRVRIQIADRPRLDKATKQPTGERNQNIEAYFPID